MDIRPIPKSDGTVDLLYALESKANDQNKFSDGWGQTGIIGKLSLKFTNFSVKHFLNPSTYKGVIPQGEGQTLTLSAQTNARYYQAYSLSFYEPWFGGKRPNSFSVSAYYSRQTALSSSYYNNNYNYYNPYDYYNNYYGNSSYYGSNSNYEYAYDPDKSIQMIGATVGFGKRLSWPDDLFQFSAALSYQLYILKQWNYNFPISDGTSNNVNLELTLMRNSIDNPIYTRRGSTFSVSATLTPPYSLFVDTKDYSKTSIYAKDKIKWLEYYKIKVGAKTFTPLTSNNKTLVLMTRADFGFLGYYNKYRRSPFESYYMGGDGMSGYSTNYITETIPLRGYDNGAITDGYYNVATTYARVVAELRFPLMLQPSSTIYALAFVEAGNAWTELKYFNPFSMKRSAGVGVRIFLPMIGMMGIDWAYGFDPVFNSRTYSGSNFHFVIGQEF